MPSNQIDQKIDLNHPVKEERLRQGVKESELAELAGITVECLSQCENFHHYPHAKTRKSLAEALGCRQKYLFPPYVRRLIKRKKKMLAKERLREQTTSCYHLLLSESYALLEESHARIVEMHLGLSGNPLSFHEIGKEYGFSHEYARQIYLSAIKTLVPALLETFREEDSL